jgi:hypothetical protein
MVARSASTISRRDRSTRTSWRIAAADNPFVVGAMLLDYTDEPRTGRGTSDGVGNITSDLVAAEDPAFGLIEWQQHGGFQFRGPGKSTSANRDKITPQREPRNMLTFIPGDIH